MFFVYVIYSPSSDKIYIGYSSDLERRLFEHNHAIKGYTLKFRPWVILFSEKYPDKKSAMAREKQLKSGHGREYIRKFIATQFPK